MPTQLNVFKTKLGLGTAQFGMTYGVANRHGQPGHDEVKQILDYAQQNHIPVLDTAASYGNSEAVLGKLLPVEHPFKIVTKVPHFEQTVFTQTDAEDLLQRVHQSLTALNQKKIYGLLLHDVHNALCVGSDYLYNAMQRLKQQGIIDKIGFSVYTRQQIEQLSARYDFDLIQVPISIFDQRLLEDDILNQLKQKNVEIHARSVFLQGLLFFQPETLPAYFSPIQSHIKNFHDVLQENRITPLQAALSFAHGIEALDVVLCGIERKKQLEEICATAPPLPQDFFASFKIHEERFINPMLWAL